MVKCIKCGKQAEYMSTKMISPVCKDCREDGPYVKLVARGKDVDTEFIRIFNRKK